MKKGVLYIMFAFLLVVTSCEKWPTTADVSHVSELPKFDLVGGDFISIHQSDTAKYSDPGATATANGKTLTVYSSGTVDLSVEGVYLITYYAVNSDGLRNTAERIIAVTNYNVSGNDLSGTYTGTNWTPQVESRVRKIDSNGLYQCSEVMGYPGTSMPGRFVDLGNNELVLLHGKGYFGKYETVRGTYSKSTLSWTISLTDDPYNGIKIPVLWKKKE